MIIIVLGILSPVILVEVLIRRRRAQQQALLCVMASAAERFIPLVSAVEAFARDEGGLFGQQTAHLARLLRDGVPLPVAMKQSWTLYPMEIKPILHVGQESGAMAAALRHAASRQDAYRKVLGEVAGKLAYLFVVVFFAINILTFVMLKIVPSFQKIFEDFDAELPPLTQTLIDVSSWFVPFGFFSFLIVPAFWAAIGYTVLRYYGWIHWDPPGLSRLARRLDSAVILDSLALAAERQKPLAATLAVLANTYHKGDIRGRLHNVVCDINAGADWCDSLAKRGLVTRADRAVLQAAQTAGNLPWALREMADSGRRRLALRLQAWVQVAYPPVILTLGAFVAFVVVALFLPLIHLTMGLT
ncbi:MAG: type II secretion system F family protein [Thermoguttaceae bacterium]